MIVLHLLQLYSVKSQGNAAVVVQIYWTHVRPVRPPAGAPKRKYNIITSNGSLSFCTAEYTI